MGGPRVSDILALSLAARLYGVFIVLVCAYLIHAQCGFETRWWFVREIVPFWIGIGVGILCFVVGWGLARFHRWAWWGGVVVLAPLFVALGVFALVHHLGAMGRPLRFGPVQTYLTVSLYVFMPLTVLLAVWVLWVLFSKGGRRRYRRQREIIEEARENPDSALGRAFGARRPRPAPAAPPEDAGTDEGGEGA